MPNTTPKSTRNPPSYITFRALPQDGSLDESLAKLFDYVMGDDLRAHDEDGNTVAIHVQSIAGLELGKRGLEAVEAYFKGIEETYIFVPCHIKKEIGHRTFDGGMLIYDDGDLIHEIYYYVQFDMLYEHYKSNCRGEHQAFSVQLIYNELLKHLLYACIPRLMQDDI